MKRFRNHNGIMVLGTAAASEDGELYLSAAAKSRCDRAAEGYFGHRFKRTVGSMLIAGGYCKEFGERPPIGREARLMADYLINQYTIPPNNILIEDGSKTTEENFEFSLQAYPEFFEDIVSGQRKLGLVSNSDHLARAALIGCRVLVCSERQFVRLPTWRLLGESSQTSTPVRAVIELSTTEALAADM